MKRFIAIPVLVLCPILIMVGCGDKGIESEEPTATITNPADNAVVYEVVEITADARDNKGITMVEFYINGVIPDSTEAIDMRPPYSYSWNTLSLPDSSTSTIYAKAYDTDDHIVESKLITVMVNNSLAIPSPVVLQDPSDITASSMTLTWTASTNEDFQCYKIFQSLSEGVGEDSERIATVYDDSTASYEVSDLVDNETYFFKVYVYDAFDFFAGSNEVEGITVNIAPTAATLNDPRDIREDSMILSWSRNENHDFSSYKLFRSLTPGVDTLSTLVTEIRSRSLTTYTDTNLDPETEYFYRVFVYDMEGVANGSNAVSGTTFKIPEEITVYLPGDATMEMVWIEPGTFMMGSPEDTPAIAYSCERPQHEVTITQGFYLGKYEVTKGQWESVMGTRPWMSGDHARAYVQMNPNCPAEYMLWNDWQTFILRLNEAEGTEVYRLPTEAEWEYVCRAGTTTLFSFGDDWTQLDQYAWWRDNAWSSEESYAHEVGAKRPNPWGLYDMHGNVCEWCQDCFGPYSSDVQTDPTGPTSGELRVARGGTFFDGFGGLRSAIRFPRIQDWPRFGYGARLVREGP